MLVWLISYLFTISCMFLIIHHIKNRTFPLPKIDVFCGGLKFVSFKRHKIFVGNVKLLKVDECIYLKQRDKIIKISNVKNATIKDGYLSFNANGEVKVSLKNNKWFRYLQMDICSSKFELGELKQNAIAELMNNLFDRPNCIQLKRYIRFLRGVLKIDFSCGQLKVKQNLYHLPFEIKYEMLGKQKCVRFNQ